MAYGRVNIIGKGGGLEDFKTIDEGTINDSYVAIDYTRKRKVRSEFSNDWNILIEDFNDNLITKITDADFRTLHVGFLETKQGDLYNIETGKKVSNPTNFRNGQCFILNNEMDFIDDRDGYRDGYIRYSNGNVKHYLKEKRVEVLFIQKDTVYFINYESSTMQNVILYKYEDRKLTEIVKAKVNSNTFAFSNVNFL